MYKQRNTQAWREVGDRKIYARSIWEANYSRYLQFQKEKGFIKDWLHEPTTFWFLEIKRGVRSYLPDFKVIRDDESYYWVEVKGYMDPKSRTKIKRFKKYYPTEALTLINAKWFRNNNSKMKLLIRGWESG